jgi:hypothetical protein
MLTGGFKTRLQAEDALASDAVDIIGLARALVLEPSLAALWQADQKIEPTFPRFSNAPEGGITAWHTMRLTEIGADRESSAVGDLEQAFETMKYATKPVPKYGCATLPTTVWDKLKANFLLLCPRTCERHCQRNPLFELMTKDVLNAWWKTPSSRAPACSDIP